MSEREDPQEQFQHWLAHMSDALETFMDLLPPAVQARLDYQPESLAILERFLLDRYENVDAVSKSSETTYLDGAARYVGEVFRKGIGGRWQIRFDDPKYVYFGLPELTFLERRDTPVCPLTLVTASLDRRTGEYLAMVFRNSAKRIAAARQAQ